MKVAGEEGHQYTYPRLDTVLKYQPAGQQLPTGAIATKLSVG